MKLQEFISMSARNIEKVTERNPRPAAEQQSVIARYSEWRNDQEWGSHYERLDNGRQAVME